MTVIGDACHPMSMFKGQGANQALMDGPLLAQWLLDSSSKLTTKSSKCKVSGLSSGDLKVSAPVVVFNRDCRNRLVLSTRLRCFEREMMSRAAPKVALSREAALNYHSYVALKNHYGFEGLDNKFDQKKATKSLSENTEQEESLVGHPIVKLLEDDRISANYCDVINSLPDISHESEKGLEEMVWESFKRSIYYCSR